MSKSKGTRSPPYPQRERRIRSPDLDEVEPVVLTRKLANAIDGVSLEGHNVGDRLPLNPHDANMLIAEGWARLVPESQRRHTPEQGTVSSMRPRQTDDVDY